MQGNQHYRLYRIIRVWSGENVHDIQKFANESGKLSPRILSRKKKGMVKRLADYWYKEGGTTERDTQRSADEKVRAVDETNTELEPILGAASPHCQPVHRGLVNAYQLVRM